MTFKKAKILIFMAISLLFSGCISQDGKLSISSIVGKEKKAVKVAEEMLIEKKEISILFVGDIMFDRSIRQFAEKKGNNFIFEKTRDLLSKNDLTVANLEGPITENKSKSINTNENQKEHFIFTFDKSLASTMFENNIKLVNLGNNHILNFGENGLNQTKNYLEKSGIEYFGGMESGKEKYIIKDISGIKIGFICFNQFGGSTSETIKNIVEAKNKTDVLMVYAHWGKEYVKVPSDNIKNIAHSFIDNGANLIIGTHPHVVQDKEEYKGKTIYYSLGNFIFDQYFSKETQNGMAVKVNVNLDNKNLEFQEIPLFLEKNGQTLPIQK